MMRENQVMNRILSVFIFIAAVGIGGGPLQAGEQIAPPEDFELARQHLARFEKEGFLFEFFIPDRVWEIPAANSKADNRVKLGLRITNLINAERRISRFKTLTVELIGPDGRNLVQMDSAEGGFMPTESDCPFLQHGETTTFMLTARLSPRDGGLRLAGSGLNGGWGSAALRPGRYHVRLKYENKNREFRDEVEDVLLKGVWTGALTTPWLEVHVRRPLVPNPHVVEQDGARFEIFLPDREWIKPENQPRAATPTTLALRITNDYPEPLRFYRFDTLHVQMSHGDGKELRIEGVRKRSIPPRESDCPLVEPGESVTFFIDARLSWSQDDDDNELHWRGTDGFGGGWRVAQYLVSGTYKVRIAYANRDPHVEVYANGISNERKRLDEVWIGDIKTPFVDVQLTPPGALKPNAAEKDRVQFEFVVPEREWVIPQNKPGDATAVELGLKITNRTDKARRFSRFDTIYPQMIGPNGKLLHPGGGRNGTLPAKESDCPLVKPGESATFVIDARLFRQNEKLHFGGSDGFGGVWGFSESFQTGRYKIGIWYLNENGTFGLSPKATGGKEETLADVWTGDVRTPFVEVVVTDKPKEPPPADVDADAFGAETKGLRARVSLAKRQFAVGEAVNVKYVVKNVSKEEQTLWHSGFWANHQVIVHGADGKEPPLTRLGRERRAAFSPGGERGKSSPWKVPPDGEDVAYEKYNLTTLYDLTIPGRYTVQYFYEEQHGGWEGRLPSNEASFEVVAMEEKVINVSLNHFEE